MKSFFSKVWSGLKSLPKTLHFTLRDWIMVGVGVLCIAGFIVFACLAQIDFGTAYANTVSYGQVYAKTDAESVALKESYLASIHSLHITFLVYTVFAFFMACVALFMFVFVFANLKKVRKSRKLTLVFVTLAIFFVVGFFYSFAFVSVLRSDYTSLGSSMSTANVKNNPGLMSFVVAQRGVILKIYTAYSVFTYFVSLCAIVAVGLGLKLVDKAKEKEEEADNLYVFVEEEGDAEIEMSSEG